MHHTHTRTHMTVLLVSVSHSDPSFPLSFHTGDLSFVLFFAVPGAATFVILTELLFAPTFRTLWDGNPLR